MHVSEREKAILDLIGQRGFIAFRELEKFVDASPATLRRDLKRLAAEGRIDRVRGGASLPKSDDADGIATVEHLAGIPFHDNIGRMRKQKEVIGRSAAALCEAGSAVMIDGGSTTLQMCRHLHGLNLQVLTNSLHVVSALLPQAGTRIQIPGGSVFREQNIILSAAGDDLMPRFHAPKLFMGAAAVASQGIIQADVVLVTAERKLIERAEELILLVDSSKFQDSSGSVVCDLQDIDIVVTDKGIESRHVEMLRAAGVELIVAD